jgi:1,4-alpha-glucan branching enzyme
LKKKVIWVTFEATLELIEGFPTDCCLIIFSITIKIRHMVQKTLYKTKDYAKVKFSIDASNANSVELLGLNDNWKNGIQMDRKKNGTFLTEINLPKNSRHEFKYLIDKQTWLNDEGADHETPNVFGGTNSVVNI